MGGNLHREKFEEGGLKKILERGAGGALKSGGGQKRGEGQRERRLRQKRGEGPKFSPGKKGRIRKDRKTRKKATQSAGKKEEIQKGAF